MTDTQVKRPKRRKIASLDRRKARMGWLFVLPFIIGLVFIYLPMLWDSIVLTFKDTADANVLNHSWVGFKNFNDAFTDINGIGFVQILGTGIKQMIFDIPAILLFSLFMAVLLNQKIAGRAAFRAIFFLPVVVSVGLIPMIDNLNAGVSMGFEGGIDTGSGENTSDSIVSALDIERLFSNMKVGQGLVEYVVTMINKIFEIVGRSGVQMLIFLSGLQSISPAIYEACKIDGASGWETFWKVTFPMISPMILVNAIYTVIDALTDSGNTVMAFIKENSSNVNVRTARYWIYFLIVMLIIGAVAGIMSAYVFYQRKD